MSSFSMNQENTELKKKAIFACYTALVFMAVFAAYLLVERSTSLTEIRIKTIPLGRSEDDRSASQCVEPSQFEEK